MKPYTGAIRVISAPYRRETRMEVTIENAAAVVDVQISADGRIYGLTKYAGLTAKVVVLEKKR
jgi:hypothetical protein